jgi:CRISPR-associated protein (TIGR03986 family)
MPLQRPLTSARVTRKERAGRAPYNFVPLPEIMKASFKPPPSSARWGAELLSGHVDLKIKAETDFYIRGMWQLGDYVKQTNTPQTKPFEVAGQLRLPGSSIRGMVRTLIEILGKAPLDPVNDTQLFFRPIGASENREHESFETQARDYKRRMVSGSGDQHDPTGPKATAGFLHADHEDWWIRPAQRHHQHKTSWYRTAAPRHEPLSPVPIHFRPEAPALGRYSRPVYYNFGVVRTLRTVDSPKVPLSLKDLQEGCIKGWLIRPGKMPKSHWDWIILPEDESANTIPIPQVDRVSYLEGGITPAIREAKLDYAPARYNGEGVPCFYIQWNDSSGSPHVSFGHTPYFRLPYQTTPGNANPRSRPGGKNWDLAQLLFGRVGNKTNGQTGARGRVFFEDGLLVQATGFNKEISESVLGQPQPTTFQHYLVQTPDDGKDPIYWDSPEATLRGHKLYWHRPGADTAPPPDAKEKVRTKYQKAHQGNIFSSRVRFENLRGTELGALLTALELPVDCRHHIGMGKPLGLGSFHIEITALRNVDRPARYGAFFENPARLNTGIRAGEGFRTLIQECKQRFAEWYFEGRQLTAESFEQELWKDARLAQLRALLTWQEFVTEEDRKLWLNKTRYLNFGSVECNHQAKSYNEYRQTGVNPCTPLAASRRPLPPASQVINDKSGCLPADPTPLWLTEADKKRLRNAHP